MSLATLAQGLRRIIPDPFVVAVGLTLAALLFCLVQTGDWSLSLNAWVSGFTAEEGAVSRGGLWSLLPFAMQMCLILVTGYAVARTPLVVRAIDAVAMVPQNTRAAIILIGATSMGLALINWGLGLVAGALLAREVGQRMRERGIAVHYPLLAAAGYLGLAVWHGGLSGSAPLKMASEVGSTGILGPELGVAIGAIPLSETVFSLRNLIITPLVAVVMLGVLMLLVPNQESAMQQAPAADSSESAGASEPVGGLSGWLETTPWVTVLVGGLALAWIIPELLAKGLDGLTLNSMNLAFLGAGLVACGSPQAYLRAVSEGARACAGIILQFPLYGGILGLLLAGGVAEIVASVLPSSAAGLSVSTFLSAGLLNLFVPSGGGQFALQGPLVMDVVAENGLDAGRILLALSWGDQWTNLFQPFWALPLLGITGTRAGDLLGPTLFCGLAAGLVFVIGAWVG